MAPMAPIAPIAPIVPILTPQFVFKHPFTMMVAGPTSCGKTTWIKTLLENANTMIVPPPQKIVWVFKRWQPMYTEMQRTIPNIQFVEGISTGDDNTSYGSVYIFDDLMKDATKNDEICELYTEGSHHKNMSVICLLQNLYNKGKEKRTMNLNSQYLLLFKKTRDRQQVAVLARQMYPNKANYFLERF